MKIINHQSFRENIRVKIAVLIDTENNNAIVGNIEKGVYNYAIEEATKKNIIKKWDNDTFVLLYINRLRSIYNNLRNDKLVKKIKDGEVKPEDVGFMSHQELNPDKWTFLIECKTKRDASKFNVNVEASTDVYICRRCKSRKCTYEAVQIRSSDEPMTIFVNCLSCGKNWTC